MRQNRRAVYDHCCVYVYITQRPQQIVMSYFKQMIPAARFLLVGLPTPGLIQKPY
jgi:hypothetical protein